MNRLSTVLRKAFSVKTERSSGSPMRWPAPFRIAHWQQVSFVPLADHVRANDSPHNQSETFSANIS